MNTIAAPTPQPPAEQARQRHPPQPSPIAHNWGEKPAPGQGECVKCGADPRGNQSALPCPGEPAPSTANTATAGDDDRIRRLAREVAGLSEQERSQLVAALRRAGVAISGEPEDQ